MDIYEKQFSALDLVATLAKSEVTWIMMYGGAGSAKEINKFILAYLTTLLGKDTMYAAMTEYRKIM